MVKNSPKFHWNPLGRKKFCPKTWFSWEIHFSKNHRKINENQFKSNQLVKKGNILNIQSIRNRARVLFHHFTTSWKSRCFFFSFEAKTLRMVSLPPRWLVYNFSSLYMVRNSPKFHGNPSGRKKLLPQNVFHGRVSVMDHGTGIGHSVMDLGTGCGQTRPWI